MSSIGILKKGWLQKPPLGVQINHAHPLARGLVGCWLFNEGGGDIAYDLSGYGNHGTLNGMAFPPTTASGWNPGRDGVGLMFDGSNDYVDCGNDPSLNITDAITIEAWIKMVSTSTDGMIVAKWGTFADTQWSYFSRVDVTNPRFGFSADGATTCGIKTYTDLTIVQNRWHHVVSTWRKIDGTMRAYLDGVASSQIANCSNNLFISSKPVSIGRDSDNAVHHFNGSIDQVRIYNRALTADEIQQLYIDPYCTFEPATKYTVVDERLKSKFVGGNTAAMQLIQQ